MKKKQELKINDSDFRRKAQQIVEFAIANNLTINPSIGYGYSAENYLRFGNCACAPERKMCPCEQCIGDVTAKGWCKCHLFYRSLEVFYEDRVSKAEFKKGGK